MTEEQAQEILDSGLDYFDYLFGRVMKVNLGKQGETIVDLDFSLYNRDNGKGKGESVTQGLC